MNDSEAGRECITRYTYIENSDLAKDFHIELKRGFDPSLACD